MRMKLDISTERRSIGAPGRQPTEVRPRPRSHGRLGNGAGCQDPRSSEVEVESDNPGGMRTAPRPGMRAQQDDTTEQGSICDRKARGQRL